MWTTYNEHLPDCILAIALTTFVSLETHCSTTSNVIFQPTASFHRFIPALLGTRTSCFIFHIHVNARTFVPVRTTWGDNTCVLKIFTALLGTVFPAPKIRDIPDLWVFETNWNKKWDDCNAKVFETVPGSTTYYIRMPSSVSIYPYFLPATTHITILIWWCAFLWVALPDSSICFLGCVTHFPRSTAPFKTRARWDISVSLQLCCTTFACFFLVDAFNLQQWRL